MKRSKIIGALLIVAGIFLMAFTPSFTGATIGANLSQGIGFIFGLAFVLVGGFVLLIKGSAEKVGRAPVKIKKQKNLRA